MDPQAVIKEDMEMDHYLVLGKEDCSRCAMAKRILEQKGYAVVYEQLTDLPADQRRQYVQMAHEQELMSLPIVIKNDTEAISMQQL